MDIDGPDYQLDAADFLTQLLDGFTDIVEGRNV